MNKIAWRGLLFVGLVLISSCDAILKDDPTAEDFLRLGWEFFEIQQYSDASAQFQNAINADPNRVEAYIGLGLCQLRLDQYTEAKASLLFAKTKSPAAEESIAISVILSFMYVRENDADNVIAELSDKIVGTDDWGFGHGTGMNAVDIHNLLCEAFIMKGTYGSEETSALNALDAWGQVKKSLALDPTDAKALELRILLVGSTGQNALLGPLSLKDLLPVRAS